MKSRDYCSRCFYPSSTCICFAISTIEYRTRLLVLQHPSEQGNAKNTARLISLVVPKTTVVVGESPEDFQDIKSCYGDCSQTAILFPGPGAMVLGSDTEQPSIKNLILLDGTWRKTRKIWNMNPWLQDMRIYSLQNSSPSAYSIRKSNQPGGLSTLEAAATALELIEFAETGPLYNAFNAMQNHWHKYKQS